MILTMSKELISDKQGISIMTMFILGSTLALGTGWQAKHDIWLAILLGAAFAIPAMFVYARILSLYPGKDLFDILEIIFGKIISKFIHVLYFGFSFLLGTLVIRDFSEFINVAGLPGVPEIIPKLFLTIVCILAIKDGIEVLGRISTFILPLALIIILLVTLVSLPLSHLSNVKPVLYNGLKPVFRAAFSTFSFPFAETIVFTMVYDVLKRKVSSYKVYYMSLLIGGLIIMIVSVSNVLILGAEVPALLYFPSYSAMSVIKYGDFLERIEVAVTIVFLVTGFAKISVCMYAATKGFAKIFYMGDYRTMVAPVGLSMAVLSTIIFENAAESMLWTKNILPYYCLPFQVILPVLVLIAAEIKIRLEKKSTTC